MLEDGTAATVPSNSNCLQPLKSHISENNFERCTFTFVIIALNASSHKPF